MPQLRSCSASDAPNRVRLNVSARSVDALNRVRLNVSARSVDAPNRVRLNVSACMRAGARTFNLTRSSAPGARTEQPNKRNNCTATYRMHTHIQLLCYFLHKVVVLKKN